MNIFYRRFLLVAALLCFGFCMANAQKKKPVKAVKKVVTFVKPHYCLDSLLLDTSIMNANIGVYIQDFNTKELIENYQGNKFFLPASNTKIFTCYAAMKNLGDSLLGLMYRQDDDTSITFLPAGDPSFLHKDFKVQKVFDFLKTFKKITPLFNSKNKFKPYGNGWSWNDYEESYMAERSVMPLYGNLITASDEGGKLKIEPLFFTRNILDSILINAVKHSDYKHKKLGENEFTFSKNDFINGKKLEVPFTTGNHLLPFLLDDTLHNISNFAINISTIDSLKPINKLIYSQPTDSLLKPMMHNSDNFFAEQTLLMTSFKRLGYMSDEIIIDTLLKNEFKDLPQKPRWVDGSGLSRYNLFTPQDFVFVLNKMKQEFDWNRIANIFPTSGQGTLKNFYKNYAGKIWAKTGSMGNTYCISGYLKTNAGKDFSFSVMVNNYYNTSSANIRTLLEKYLTAIINKN